MTPDTSAASLCVCLYDPAYPQYIAPATLSALVPGPFDLVAAAELSHALDSAHSLILAHGPYFPKSAWNAVLAFLQRGGTLIALGGMPWTRPVRDDGTSEPAQFAYSAEALLGPVFPITLPAGPVSLRATPAAALLDDCSFALPAAPGQFWTSYPKLTQASDHPHELGSAGPVDTVLTPLLYAMVETTNGMEPAAAVATLLDHRQGRFAGGRWLLVPWQPADESDWLSLSEALRRLIALAMEPAHSIELRPALACYEPGSRPTLIIAGRAPDEIVLAVRVVDVTGEVLYDDTLAIAPAAHYEKRIPLPPTERAGLYRATATLRGPSGQPTRQTTGFWVWDAPLIASTRGKQLVARRDYLYQGDALFPLFGTTYMDSVVQRRFLTLPNPARWDTDFAAMRAAGVNTVRTGIWTAWRQFMPLAGFANEALLRALDAFVLTACAHNIQLIFTFFAFSPPLFEGENPWFDPRALAGQEAFLASITSRYADAELVSWDLINEPSFGDPQRIFSQRPQPSRDRFEQDAFRSWLQQRHTLEELQLRWRCTPNELPTWASVMPPDERDFSYRVSDTDQRRMLRAADYTLFSQHAISDWADRMRAVIRATGSSTLVGVGQDESGARPAPQFYATGADYTTTHPWWNNDALLWDMLIDKTPHTPNIVQETGVMLVRDIDGHPLRSESEVAALLERKLYLSLLARGAGMIQWLWHTNALMTSDNENSIGLLRADGSAKPEYGTMVAWGRFVERVGPLLVDEAALPPVWVVVPYSQWFVRPDLGVEASQRAVRALGYECGIIPQLVGEQQVAALLETGALPQTIIVPGAQLIQEAAWRALRGAAERGATLVVNGVLGYDEHALLYDTGLDHAADPRPVCRFVQLTGLQGEPLMFTFGGEKLAYVKQAHNDVRRIDLGNGTLFWSGVPIELSDNPAAIAQVYRSVLGLAARPSAETPVLVVRRQLRQGELLLFVSESAQEQQHTIDGRTLRIAPNRAGAALVSPTDVITFGGVELA